MPRHSRYVPSPAMVVACLALLISVGGVGYAVIMPPPNSVGTKQLKRSAVTSKKIARNAVTSGKIRNGQVTGADVNEASLGQVPSAAKAAHATIADSLLASEPWHEVGRAGEPPFLNDWGNETVTAYFETAGFYKDRESVVHLKGWLATGSAAPIFDLPSGYRPAKIKYFPSAPPGAYVEVSDSGRVSGLSQPAGCCPRESIDGITFRVP